MKIKVFNNEEKDEYGLKTKKEFKIILSYKNAFGYATCNCKI